MFLKGFSLFPNLVNLGEGKEGKGIGSGGQGEEQMTCLVSDTLPGRGQNRTLAVFPGNEGTVVPSPTGFQSAVCPSGGGLLGVFHPHLGVVMM